ncbi:MAG TPA: nicotinate-nucleotide--dimethylbenzimidazole phosphoribosyltransferase, partial [Anaerolineaceae bacterium]|nr:nicotinate-nucleotide--dimethylbenzimidazole phosphoribosyltransferase [Anaerolineaceae bacterium]
VLAAASRRVPVVVDGYIAGAAALIAIGLAPEAQKYLVASHESAEPGAEICTQLLGLEALFDLNFRLGEGTGSVLAFQLVEAAVRIQDEMATFDEAGVDEKL